MPHKRRRDVLKAIGGSAAITAIAGCQSEEEPSGSGSGSGSDGGMDGGTDGGTDGGSDGGTGGDSDEFQWPPSQNLVDVISPSNPGSTRDTHTRTWAGVAPNHYDEDISMTVTSTPGGEGLVAIDTLWNASPDGGTMGSFYYGTALVEQITNPDVNFTVTDFIPVYQMASSTRGIQLNHQTTPIEEHWQWSWDEFVEYANENTLRLGWTSVFHVMVVELLMRWDDQLNDDAIDLIPHNSGSEARAAMARGDLDLYVGTFDSNYPARNEFYKNQFVFVDQENYPEFSESMINTASGDGTYETVPERGLMTNTTFQERTGRATDIVDIVLTNFCTYLPPETPDEAVEIHRDAWSATAQDERTQAGISEAFAEIAFQPLGGEELQRALESKADLYLNDPDVNEMIQESF